MQKSLHQHTFVTTQIRNILRPREEKFGDLTTADHKSSMREVNLEAITGTQSWYKILPLNGFSRTREEQKLLRRRKEGYESFSSLL